MPKADKAEELEYLPSGKRSRTEAKEEDVEMEEYEEQPEEELPQDEHMKESDYGRRRRRTELRFNELFCHEPST